ncbi:MAG TPA: autotransporter-associated beta strand repeat-containing protein [Kiritimatiellia bacterium]|nr:autotransporter-associated beta strand repeat-containing protein [Kiritimatiellia bacterium]
MTSPRIERTLHTLAYCVALATAASVSGAERTWTGAGADARWTTAANWAEGEVAASDTLRFGGTVQPVTTNDFATDTAFSGLTFLPDAVGFTLAGNRITLNGDLVNQSSVSQTVSLPLLITATADRTLNAANGPMTLTDSLNYDTGTTSRSYKKTGSYELLFTGSTQVTNLYSRFALNEGTLRFAPGSMFHLVNFSNDRNVFRIGDVANKQSAIIVEPGADVALGGLSLQMTSVPGGTGSFDLLVNGGRFELTGTDNTFGDMTGNRTAIVINNGGIFTNGTENAWVHAGTRCPFTLELDGGTVWLQRLSLGRESGAGDRQLGRADIDIRRGLFVVNNAFHWMSTSWTLRTNIVTLGNGTLGSATLSSVSMSRATTSGTAILNLNGGVLECRNGSGNFLSGLNQVNMMAGGVIIDTSNNAVNITEPIMRDPSLSLDVRDGGLTKRGAGSLTFSGPTNEFNGPLRVEDGSLRISPGMLSDLEEIYLAPGRTLSFRGSHRQNLAPQRLCLGDAVTTSRLDLDVSVDDLTCDTIHIPIGGYIGKINLHLKQRGPIDRDFNLPGDYVLFTYASEPPDITLLTHANRAFGTTSSFIVDRAAKTVTLRLMVNTTETAWSNPAGGAWETADNWTTPPINAPEARARFWDAITAPATVTLNTDTRIGGFSFNNSQSYTLSGNGTLTIGDQFGTGYLVSDVGSHAVALDIELAAPINMGAPASHTLTLSGVLSGSGGIIKGNAGTLHLTAANTFSGGVRIDGGTLTIPSLDVLGSGPLTLAGGTALMTGGGSATYANPLYVQANGVLDLGSTDLTLTGPIDWTGAGILTKQGEGELILAGSANENNSAYRFNFRQGVTRLAAGTAYTLRGNDRDVLQTTYSAVGQTSKLVIEPGAVLTAGGMRLMAGSYAGTSTVHVAGGRLDLLDAGSTIVNATGGRADLLIDNGGSLYAAKGWFNLGVNGLGTLTVTNGSVSLSLLSMAGYADTISTGNRKGSAAVTVGPGGVFEVRDYFNWINDDQNNLASLRLDGGRLLLPVTARAVGSIGTASVVLNGGVFDCTGLPTLTTVNAQIAPSLDDYLFGVDELFLGADGITIDTRLHNVTITQPLVMESGSTVAAGFTKTGTGILTLAGDHAFNAPITVQVGTLALTSLPNNAVQVVSGATLNPSFNSVRTDAVTTATFGDNAVLAVDLAEANSSDHLAVAGTLVLGSRLTIWVNGDTLPGTFTLFTYGTLTGSANALRIGNPDGDFTYQFTDTGNAITLTVAANPNSVAWANDADGVWSANANWTPQTVPNGVGHSARFDLSFAQPRTVTLDLPVTLSALLFDAPIAPQVTGTASLSLNHSAMPSSIEVASGHPTLAVPVAVPAETTAWIAPDTSLTLAKNLSGTGALSVQGGGALMLMATNTIASTRVADATLQLGPDASLEAPLTLDNATLTTSADHTSAAAITSGTYGATVTPLDSTTLTLSGPVSGTGGLVKTGSSTLALTGPLTYQGTTVSSGGTLALATPPPADLRLGAGTFVHAGAAASLPGYLLNTESNGTAAVFANTADVTVTGRVQAVAGGFVKQGTGTLAFTYPGEQTLCVATQTALQDTLLNIGPNGDGPTAGFNPFTVSEGTVVLGAEGQVNTFSGSISVGHFSTADAGAETAAHLRIEGGTTTVAGHIAVGRGNGNTVTAPTPFVSTLTIDGGTVAAVGFAIGHNGGNTVGFNARPAVIVNGGDISLTRINIAEHLGSDCTLTLNDGTITLAENIQVGHQTSFGGGGTALITVNGGELVASNEINLGITPSATGTLHVAGGLVSARNIVVGGGYGRILLDGGTLHLWMGPMNAPQDVQIMAGGARIEVRSGRFTIARPLLAGEANDGGLVKIGAGMLALDSSEDHTFTGPVTVEEGILAFRNEAGAPLPASTTLTVSPGASLYLTSEDIRNDRVMTVANATLGAAEPAVDATLAVWCGANSTCDQLAVTGNLTLGQVAVLLYQRGSLDPALYAGTYPILSYAGIDPDLTGLSVANPIASHTYAFSLDTVNKRVLLTVTTQPGLGEAIWTADNDGLWSQGPNWQNGTAPTAIDTAAFFANVLSEARTVTVDTPATLGGLIFDATNRYTVSGGETLTLSGSAPQMTLMRGDHEVSVPLAVAGAAAVSLAPNGNTLTIAGSVTGDSAALSLDTAGTLQVTNCVIDTALLVNAGTMRLEENTDINGIVRVNDGEVLATGNATLDGAVELPPGNRSLRANSGATLTVNGTVVGVGTLVKDGGGGTLELTAANTHAGGTRVSNGTLALRGNGTPGRGDLTMAGGLLATLGSAPVAFDTAIGFDNNTTVDTTAPLTTGGTLAMPDPRALTKRGTNVWSIGGTLFGSHASYRFYLRDGTVRFAPGSRFTMDTPGLNLRNQFDATSSYEGSALGLIIEPDAEVTFGGLGVQFNTTAPAGTFDMVMNGGRLTLTGTNPLGFGDVANMAISVVCNDGEFVTLRDDAWCDIGTRSPVDWTLNGGLVSLGRPAFGRMNDSGAGRFYGRVNLTIHGGTFEAREFFSWKSTDYAYMTNIVMLGNGTPLQGRFSIPATKRYHSGGRVFLNLNGGVLETRGLCSAVANLNGSSDDYLYGVNELTVLTGGAVIDTLTNSVAIRQTFTAGAEGDGGVTKLGSGTLTLVEDVALTGRVHVAEGTLDAAFTTTPDLAVGATGVLDLGQNVGAARFTHVTGTGTVTNGNFTVTGSLSAGDAPGEIGVFHAETLAFENGVTLYLDWSEAANDLFAVSGTLTGASGGTIDFGREEGDAIPVPMTTVIGTYGNFNGGFRGWKVRNAGLPPRVGLSARIAAEDGVVTLSIANSGLIMFVR